MQLFLTEDCGCGGVFFFLACETKLAELVTKEGVRNDVEKQEERGAFAAALLASAALFVVKTILPSTTNCVFNVCWVGSSTHPFAGCAVDRPNLCFGFNTISSFSAESCTSVLVRGNQLREWCKSL